MTTETNRAEERTRSGRAASTNCAVLSEAACPLAIERGQELHAAGCPLAGSVLSRFLSSALFSSRHNVLRRLWADNGYFVPLPSVKATGV